MKKLLIICFLMTALPRIIFAQQADSAANLKRLRLYEDSLAYLGKKIINDSVDFNRKNANYAFIKMLVGALKVPNSFYYPFDSLKSITITNSPDRHFRILTWHVLNDDGSYRFYGTIQMRGSSLQMFPLNDYSPQLTNSEDSITTNAKWFGAQYYKIIHVTTPKSYYVLLGWKGNTIQTTKKVIDVLSFNDGKAFFGLPVFDGNGKTRKRVVFEYTRQASMLLRYVPEQNLIVFDHLSPPDHKLKGKLSSYGPDLSYDGYVERGGHWAFVLNLDMRNVPDAQDEQYVDPKKQAAIDKATANQ
jgi:hypothetical protein